MVLTLVCCHPNFSPNDAGVSPSGSTLSVPPLQTSTAPARHSSMGNMFASAWKKGKEKESKVDSPNLVRMETEDVTRSISVENRLLGPFEEFNQ